MNLVCPECKNNVNMSAYPTAAVEDVIECDVCGITLQITSIKGNRAEGEVVEEGK